MNWAAFFIAMGVMVCFAHFCYAVVKTEDGKPATHWSMLVVWVLSLSIGIGLAIG